MKQNAVWPPVILLQSPLFWPLQPALLRCESDAFPTLADWNKLLSTYYSGIKVERGHSLHFVAQELGKLGFELHYEPRCYLQGEVQTRENNWHDLFNALVWLTFPRAKAAINARHYRALTELSRLAGGQRGKARDMATLLDESGVIVVSASFELTGLLCTFQWKELFWQKREEVIAQMGFYVFGHGLYEKALNPYVGMTGQGLVLHVPAEYFEWDARTQLNYLDGRIAEYLNNPENCLTTRELHPVPLLGVPGWDSGNKQESYYDNTEYFRPGRRKPG